ncbi:MAG: hypothetical protein KGI58_03790 [Patescibacteria group bacterium]|nr:hypothetical protein [Patescibacteria group bacterium]
MVAILFYPAAYLYAGLSCTVTTAAACTGTVLLRMSGSTNAHAELPSQSNANYSNNVVCCTSTSSIGNSCASSNYKVFGKLSGVTNAHMQQASVNTYLNNACLSDSSTGDKITVGYQNTNCSGYDTTLMSMTAADNATVGDGSAYTPKVCATITPLLISFSISTNSVGFGNLSASSSRYANSAGTGSATEVEAHTLSASTNAAGGYIITVDGDTLTSGSNTINAIGGVNTLPSSGTNQFGLRATVSSGTGFVVSPYAASGFAFNTASLPSTVASGSGDNTTTVYSVRYLGNIGSQTPAGSYTAHLNYVITGTF